MTGISKTMEKQLLDFCLDGQPPPPLYVGLGLDDGTEIDDPGYVRRICDGHEVVFGPFAVGPRVLILQFWSALTGGELLAKNSLSHMIAPGDTIHLPGHVHFSYTDAVDDLVDELLSDDEPCEIPVTLSAKSLTVDLSDDDGQAVAPHGFE